MIDLESLIVRTQIRNVDIEPAAAHGAAEAAALLQADGKHVHVVSEGEAHCPGGRCTPAIVAGLLGTAPRPRPHLTAPLPLT